MLITSLLLLVTVYNVCGDSFCNHNCGGTPNTMCRYCPPGPSRRCGRSVKPGLTEQDKRRIVQIHNDFRRNAALGRGPFSHTGNRAARMYQLVWNDDVAKVAQRWAQQCVMGHDRCRRTRQFPSVGQNIAMMGRGEPADVEPLIKMWENEGRYVNYGNVYDTSKFSQIGHYTQMLWADTTHIGCGYDASHSGGFVKTYLVCNYAPAGNMMGERYVFKSGRNCGDCRQRGEMCRDGLCYCSPGARCYMPNSNSGVGCTREEYGNGTMLHD